MSVPEFIYDEVAGFIGTGDTPSCRLGEDRVQVRENLGEYRTFQRTPGAPDTDDFVNFALQVVYTSAGRAGFIEVKSSDPG